MVQTNIKKVGGSLGVILDKSILTEIFGWGEGTPIEIKYDTSNKCVIIRKNGVEEQNQKIKSETILT